MDKLFDLMVMVRAVACLLLNAHQHARLPRPHSMDKLFDLMVMGAKYQLLACATHKEMVQVGACKLSAAACSPRHAAACRKPHTRMHSRLHFFHQCKAPI